MKRNRPRPPSAALTLIIVFVLGLDAQAAYAYIDPGTGSNLLSSLGLVLGGLSAMLALAFFQVRRFAGWLAAGIAFLRRPKQSASTDSGERQ